MARSRTGSKRNTTSSRVWRIARSLREDCLSLPEGSLIGSEEELVQRYQVSRPTLRQAASLVSQDQLLYVRRGVGGGYFSRRPDSRSVAHTASIYFRARQTTMREIITAVEPIRAEISRLAARSKDAATKDELAKFLVQRRSMVLTTGAEGYLDFLSALRDFGQLTARLADNEPLSLFQSMLYEFCANVRQQDDLFAGKLDRMQAYYANMIQLGDAICAGDQELAVLIGSRGAKMLTEWICDDLGRNVSGLVGELSMTPNDPSQGAMTSAVS